MLIEISLNTFDLLLLILGTNIAGLILLLLKGEKMSAAMDNLNVAVNSIDSAANSTVIVISDYMTRMDAAVAAGASVNDPAIQAAADRVNAIATALLAQTAKIKS